MKVFFFVICIIACSIQVFSQVSTPIYHTVLAKETKFGIAKKYTITIADLEKWNPEIVDGLAIGDKLVIASNPLLGVDTNDTLKNIEKSTISKELTLKTNTLNFKTKKVAILLPFNLKKMEADSLNLVSDRLKKDKFLNLTLDFYAGAKMAIDSARVLGMNAEIQIIDSEETKNTASIDLNTIEDVDAIVGPFYPTNLIKTASLLAHKNIAVISPLSKEFENILVNLYQSIPSTEVMRASVLEYLQTQNGNCIAVIDPKKTAVKQYISSHQAQVKLVPVMESGSFVVDDLKRLLVSNKTNFVILETNSISTINATIKVLLSVAKTFSVQLVVLEPNETLYSDEIYFHDLVKLRLIYPSVSCENETQTAEIFRKQFRIKNKYYSNQYVIRGFDLVFDVLSRVTQNESFQESVTKTSTQQIENRFDYFQNINQGFSNKGFFILQYNSDYTTKILNPLLDNK